MKIDVAKRNIYHVTLTCGERYVVYPSVRPCKYKPYDVFYACEEGDLLYITSLSSSQIRVYFENLDEEIVLLAR